MTKPFKSTPNKSHLLEDGRIIWESRSPAVVGSVILYTTKLEPYILLSERGPGCPDEVGKFCLPCGYLDWDEYGLSGACREVWEETGVMLGSTWLKSDSPWLTNTNKESARQNISIFYLFKKFLSDGESFPEVSNANCEPDEVGDIKWVSLNEAIKMDLAFGHAKRISQLKDRLYA